MATIRVQTKIRTKEANAILAERIAVLVKKAAFDLEAQAKARAPVDTGHLRSSINTQEVTPVLYLVESPVHYSVYQEFGTRFMPAHPYMIPALEYVRPRLLEQIRAIA